MNINQKKSVIALSSLLVGFRTDIFTRMRLLYVNRDLIDTDAFNILWQISMLQTFRNYLLLNSWIFLSLYIFGCPRN